MARFERGEDFKKDPKRFSWGGGSAGGTDHILVAMLAQAAGVDPKNINYIAHSGGGEAAVAVMGRQATAGVSGFGEWLPLNAAARSVAVSYTAANLEMTEGGCLYYTENYITFAPHSLLMWSEPDPVTGAIVAWKISAGGNDRVPMTIRMDGCPHPSEVAFHLFSGFYDRRLGRRHAALCGLSTSAGFP